MSNTMKIEFTCDNATFFHEDESFDEREVADILRKLSSRVENGAQDGDIHDTNGNKVGEWSLTLEKPD